MQSLKSEPFSTLIPLLPVDQHAVRVKASNWEEHFSTSKLDAEFKVIFGGAKEIRLTREAIHNRSSEEDRRKCIEILLWGYPSGMRGNHHLDYLESIDRAALRSHEIDLTAYTLAAIGERRGLTLFGPADPAARAGVIPFALRGVHPHDVAEVLDGEGVAVRGGHHLCQPLLAHLGQSAVVRASLGLYYGRDDIDRLAEGLERVAAIFGHDR